jgi:hypothetical protein
LPILSHHSLHLPSIWSLLDVLIKMIIDSLKCYFWNVVLIVNPHFVTMKNWNWNQNTLLIVDHDLLVSIFEIFHFKSIHSLILLLWMLHLTFVFEACTFDLVALKLEQPCGCHMVFSIIVLSFYVWIYLVATRW